MEGLTPCPRHADRDDGDSARRIRRCKAGAFWVTTTFCRDGEKFVVRTDGPDGALHDYPIAYTFGVYPLQQYLIAFPGGRLQALGIAWDSRPKEQGGQRWFELYPGHQLKPDDPLHWTGRDQNYQWADCHSTDLKKNYDLASNIMRKAGPISTWAARRVTAPASDTVLGQRRIPKAAPTRRAPTLRAWA